MKCCPDRESIRCLRHDPWSSGFNVTRSEQVGPGQLWGIFPNLFCRATPGLFPVLQAVWCDPPKERRLHRPIYRGLFPSDYANPRDALAYLHSSITRGRRHHRSFGGAFPRNAHDRSKFLPTVKPFWLPRLSTAEEMREKHRRRVQPLPWHWLHKPPWRIPVPRQASHGAGSFPFI